MTSTQRPPALDPGKPLDRRRPRIMIAGEFSAGKTRLLNAIIGGSILPSNVTSTSLPPMWLTQGDSDPLRLDTSDVWHELSDFSAIDVEATKFCVLRSDAGILAHFDLIDTPGNSDPNIPPECWERMTEYADMVVWCSNSNQAWRQSEKSVWVDMPERLCEHSVLVLTHADQLPDDRSRGKVLRRVQRDASEFFSRIELLSALDEAQVAEFAQRLVTIAQNISDPSGAEAPSFEPKNVQKEAVRPSRGGRRKRGRLIVPRRLMQRPEDETAVSEDEAEDLTSEAVEAIEPEAVSTPRPAAEPVEPAMEPQPEPAEDMAPEPEPAPEPAARVVKMAPEKPRAPAEMTEDELTRLVMAKTMETAARSKDIGDGPAARAWRRISDGADLSDAASILECVRALIADIDGAADRVAERLRRKA